MALQLCCAHAVSAIQVADITPLKSALTQTGKHYLQIQIGNPDHHTIMPITAVVGPKPGPTLLVLSGIHGSEQTPIMASQRFAQTLQPSKVSGAVVFVHIANMPAYLGRTIYTSPADNKNLNRLFPGNPEGSLSEQIAHTLSEQIYPLADAVLDMHSGDGNEDLKPMWVGYYGQAGDKQTIHRSKAMAYAFGFEHIVEFQWQLEQRTDAIWAGSAAIAQGIPSIDIEAGGMNRVDPIALDAINVGLTRTLAHLGITKDTLPPPPEPTLIINREWISAPSDGSWNSTVPAGRKVSKGERLGYLTDWHGQTIFEARAPFSGIVLLTLSAPPARRGETLVIVASTKAPESQTP